MDVLAATTIVELLTRRLDHSGREGALRIKRGGDWKLLTWDDLARDVFRAAAWLRQQGVSPGDRVAQWSENRYEWIVCDLAIHLAQGIHVPIHAPLTATQAAYQIRDSGARVVVLSGEPCTKLATISTSLPQPLMAACFDESEASIGGAPTRSFWRELGEFDEAEANRCREEALRSLSADSLATILYTSGTTGEPKGVMLTHRNLVSNALAARNAFDLQAEDLRLTFLPLSHIFARTCDLYTWLAAGSRLALAESRETVIADSAAVQPTLLNGVPYFYEKVMRALIGQGRADEPHALRDMLGGRIRMCCSGGAALPDHVFDFFNSRDVPLLQGYGLTESSPVITLSTPQRVKRGSVGWAIPEVEVRIAEDGEILTRGPHVMLGYYKDQTATDACLQDGWLHTGDLGHLDEDGYLFITGRKKEILVTSGGKNIAPVYLESLLTEDPLILQAMVVGDGRKYLAALIVPNPDTLRAEIVARRIPVVSAEQALRHPDVLALYRERIAHRLREVSSYEQIGKFRLLDRGFTIESGEMTPKLTLRRDCIAANCRELIEAMYDEND